MPSVAPLLARCTFSPPGTPVTCAVSGGADSLALLVLAVAAGLEVTAVHVDHGLRPGSEREAEAVAAVAQRFGAAFRAERVDVAPGSNLEARARQARYGVLPEGVLTGHTADDQAETMLLNLLRGAGPTGLAAIPAGHRRPILGLRRRETKALCADLDLDPVVDPSNIDPRFRRNRVRHELLPLLADLSDRDPVPVLARQADLFADIDGLVTDLAATVDPTSTAELAAVRPVVAGAALRAWLLAEGVGRGHPVDGATVARLLDVVHHRATAAEVTGGWRVARRQGRLRIEAPGANPSSALSGGSGDNDDGGPCKDADHG
ncbi:MAG: tRNA lysidine(34) synthetase TilS [Aquihabitans sp.]